MQFPDKRYGVIYADPPWYFKVWGKKGTGRGAFSHYNLMSADELKAVPVESWAAKDCMLFLWVPVPLREQGMELIETWGFRYTRGKPKILRHDIPQLIIAPLREHSRKPDEARERIMMLTSGP
jgi:N6-adenosine-specific RNA methylase IME4